MNRTAHVFIALLLLTGAAWCQGPVFQQMDLWTLPYEDLSDLLRRYPGMYPLDYGTIGQPMLFRPWNLNPWELRVERDGIPQNRYSDGLYDPNLQPASELDTIRYDFLGSGGGGLFHLATRKLPVDSPYTELQIREGFYGYGTVDFAQGERIYKSATLELTGRLVYYNGMREFSVPGSTQQGGPSLQMNSSRFRRIRGRGGIDVGSRWRAEVTYGGSDVNSNTTLTPRNYYAERRDGILSFTEKDSLRTTLDPSVKLFIRQDREKWANPWSQRELTRGAVLEAHATLPLQRFTFRQISTLSTIDFPGFPKREEMWLELHALDSVGIPYGAANLFGSLRRESNWGTGIAKEHSTVSEIGARLQSVPVRNFVFHGGVQYSEELAPLAWRFGSYRGGRRPLLVSPEFADTNLIFLRGSAAPAAGKDRYWKSDVGVRWNGRGGYADVTMMALNRPGHFQNRFLASDVTVFLNYDHVEKDTTKLGLALDGSIPLLWGFRVDAWWFRQMNSTDVSTMTDMRSYERLYFERAFFTTPLIIRAHISHEYIGQHRAYSDIGSGYLAAANVVGFRISATIRGVTAIWGTENLLNEYYSVLPGYKMIGKEEYLGFMVRLWL